MKMNDKNEYITRPLLAGTVKDFSKIKYPLLATPKLDGIRCLIINGDPVSRNFKPMPNKFIFSKLQCRLPDGLDGELMIANNDEFNKIQSQIMSFEGEPDFIYHVFDYVSSELEKPYEERMKELKQLHVDLVLTDPEVAHRIQLVLPQIINSEDELNSYEEKCLSDGYEGVMIRKPDGKYKCGRSTEREGILLKIKRFKDAEAEVIGFKEKLHNVNEQEKNEFGLAKRSSKKAGMVPAGTLGTLLVRDLKTNIEFGIGSGMDDEIRQKIWDNRDDYINKFVKYKYQNVGIKEAPRFPVFLGFRHTNDMS